MKEKKEKKYGLFKLVALLIILAIVLTWLIPSGTLSSTGLTQTSVMRFGLNDLEWLLYYCIYMGLDKIIFLIFLGIMYGILSHINAYQSLVKKIAGSLSKHKQLVLVVTSVLTALLTSFLVNEFVVLIFIPFIIAILHEMKIDKISILASTFGSMLIGVVGATLGTDGLIAFANSFTSSTRSLHTILFDTILVRGGILAIGLVLLNFLNLQHFKKNNDSESATMFTIEAADSKTKKSSVIPLIIVGVLLFIISFITFTDWVNDFNINIFQKFHEFLMNVKIGDFYVIKNILGEYHDTYLATATSWNLYLIPPVMFIFTVIIALCYRVKLNDFISHAIAGIKQVIKPILAVMGFYGLVLVVYMSPFTVTIASKILSMTEGFNLATMMLSSFVVNIFHPDLALTGQAMATFLSTEYLDYINPIFVIFTSIHGLIQLFIPTSIFLGMGLTTLNVSYKDWLKYIWKLLLGMFICILIIIILITIL